MNKLTTTEFITKLESKFPGKYSVIGEYVNTSTKIRVKHLICGNEYDVRPNHILSGKGCPFCSSTRKNVGKDTVWFKNKVSDVDKNYEVLGEYINSKTKIELRHLFCNTIFSMRPEDFLRGQRCPECAKHIRVAGRKKTTNQFMDEVKNLVGEEYAVLSDYNTSKEKILMKHNLCGAEFFVGPSSFLYSNGQRLRGTRCPKCFGSEKRDEQDVADEIKIRDSEYELIPGTYKNAQEHFKLKHLICENIFETTMTNYRKGCRCPKCALKSTSKKEKSILEFIKSVYSGDILCNQRFFPDKDNHRIFYEADILIPELKIIIEFNGIYWHSEQQGKDRNYHLNKTNYFHSLGYRTIHIMEDEWEFKQEIVKKKISHILKVDKSQRVYARKCEIKDVPTKEATRFLESNHIQGATGASIKVGLYYEKKLVSIITFGKLRRSLGNKQSLDGEYELIRYATNCNVIGGFSRLLKYCKSKFNMQRIITYADLRWSSLDSNMYSLNGFSLLRKSAPGYFYFDGLKRYNRFSFRKDMLKELFPDIYEDNLTEFQIMDKTKYLRVWDCGNLVYEIKKK